jgi:peptidoglycan/LPS O-acetylase OafA/YrhL
MKKIHSLNIARGIAALVVALDHFFISPDIITANKLTYYIATFAGSFAVGLFFLISGFVISVSLQKQNTIEFIIKRFFRLYPVFAICCLLRLIANLIVNSPEAYVSPITRYFLNTSLFGNLLLWNEQNIEPIVWTLCAEVKFYIICIIIFAIGKKSPQKVYAFSILSLFLMSLLSYNYPGADTPWLTDIGVGLSTIPFMFNGAFICMYSLKHINKIKLIIGILCANIALSFGPYPNYFSLDKGAPSWLLAGIVFVFLLHFKDKHIFSSESASRFLGGLSYPLYAVHSTFVVLLGQALQATTVLKIIIYIPTIIIVAWLIHVFIEEPVNRIPLQYRIIITKIEA